MELATESRFPAQIEGKRVVGAHRATICRILVGYFPVVPLRIALLAPIAHPFPPPGYGPWEQVAYDLVEGLVELGHDVTVFAAGSGRSSGRFISTTPKALEESDLDPRLTEEQHVFRTIEEVVEGGFDILHSHLHVHVLGFSRFLPCPLVSTLHGSAWNRAHHSMLNAYKDEPFVSISNAERQFLPDLNYVATVYNGIDFDSFPLHGKKKDYLLFAGRLAPEKAPDLAIDVARRSNRRLLLAGIVEPKYREYFEQNIAPQLDDGIVYLGHATRSELRALLGEASGLLMPLRWPEPFGLVVAEAFASGTPVIAWREGAMEELVLDTVNGFLVREVDEAVRAVERLSDLDPLAVRSSARERFSRSAMAAGYEAVYQRLVNPERESQD